MSTEPERDIEKTLRAYSQHRQDAGGTPPPLHPATRKLLQDEVSRQKTLERRVSGFGLFLASWPGFILKGSVALAVLVLGALLLAPLWHGQPGTPPTLELAKNSAANERSRFVEKKETPPASTLKRDEFTPALRSQLVRKTEPTGAAASNTFKDVAVTPPPVERPRSNPVAAPVQVATSATIYSAAPAVAPATPMPTVASAVPPVTATDTYAQATSRAEKATYDFEKFGPITQQYARVNPTPNRAGRGGTGGAGGGAGGGAPNRQNLVLRSFRVEQNGGQLRVIDADGSIYTGVMTANGNLAGEFAANAAPAPLAAASPAALDQQKAVMTKSLNDGIALQTQSGLLAATNAPVAASAATQSLAPRSDLQVAAGFAFHVSGTNLTLNQPVEFSGNFVVNDQPPTGGVGGGRGARGGARATGAGGGGGGAAIGGGGFASADTLDSLAQTNVTGDIAGKLHTSVATNAVPSPFANLRLQGQALIGTNRVGINAMPTRP